MVSFGGAEENRFPEHVAPKPRELAGHWLFKAGSSLEAPPRSGRPSRAGREQRLGRGIQAEPAPSRHLPPPAPVSDFLFKKGAVLCLQATSGAQTRLPGGRTSVPCFWEPTPRPPPERRVHTCSSPPRAQTGVHSPGLRKSRLLETRVLWSLREESRELLKKTQDARERPGWAHHVPPEGRGRRRASGSAAARTAPGSGRTNMPQERRGALVRREEGRPAPRERAHRELEGFSGKQPYRGRERLRGEAGPPSRQQHHRVLCFSPTGVDGRYRTGH